MILRPRGIELLACSLLLLPMLFYPLARDQGLFAYAGQVVLDGGAPYVDVYEQKGPATHYTFAAVMALFGESAIGIRFFFFLVGLLGSQLAAAIGEGLRDRSARLPCAASYALLCAFAMPRGPWTKGQVEDLQLPISLAVVLLLGNSNKCHTLRNLSLVSLLLGIACVYKPTAILLAALVAIYVGAQLLTSREFRYTDVAKRFALCTCCFFAPALLFAGLLSLLGALDDFWLFVVEHNATVYSRLHSGGVSKWFRVIGGNWGGAVLLALFSVHQGYRESRPLWRMLWLVIIAGLLAVFWQWKFFIFYHWTPFIGALSIVTGLTLARLLALCNRLQLNSPARLAVQAVVATAALIVISTQPYHLLRTHWGTARVVLGADRIVDFQDPYICGTDTNRVNRTVSDYLRSRTSSSEKVLVWGYDVVLNVLSDRRAPTRFAMNRILMRPISPRLTEWRNEFMRDLNSIPPKYIVVADEPPRVWYLGNPRELLGEFPEFLNFIQQRYVEERTIGHFTLYHLRSADGESHLSLITPHGETLSWHE